MKEITRLRAKRHRILGKTQNIGPFIEGSLTNTKKRCGNPKCKCISEGPIHNTLLLTWKENKITRAIYISKEIEREVRKWVDEYKALKRGIKDMSVTQRKIIIELKKE